MKFSVVEIKGGFGNQLFQYNFANYLKLQKHNVWINNYWFKTNKTNMIEVKYLSQIFMVLQKHQNLNLNILKLNDRLFSQDNVKYTYISDKFSLQKPVNFQLLFWILAKYSAFLDNTKQFFIKTLSKDPNFNQV